MAHNIFLDGGTFRDGPSVSKEAFVGDLRYGVLLRSPRGCELGYVNVTRSREFKGQDHAARFGSFIFRIVF